MVPEEEAEEFGLQEAPLRQVPEVLAPEAGAATVLLQLEVAAVRVAVAVAHQAMLAILAIAARAEMGLR